MLLSVCPALVPTHLGRNTEHCLHLALPSLSPSSHLSSCPRRRLWGRVANHLFPPLPENKGWGGAKQVVILTVRFLSISLFFFCRASSHFSSCHHLCLFRSCLSWPEPRGHTYYYCYFFPFECLWLVDKRKKHRKRGGRGSSTRQDKKEKTKKRT
jgi:hypothetical protein